MADGARPNETTSDESAPTAPRARWLVPVSVALLALLVRVWALAEQRAGNPLLQLAILDDAAYLDLARGLLDGSRAGEAWFLAPLYPWVLALAGRVADVSLLTASVLSVAAGVTTAVLVTLCGRALHSSSAGLVAGGLYALAGTFVFHDVLPGQEPLLCALTAGGLLAALGWCRRGAYRTAVVVGVLGGVAALGRATSLALPLAALAMGLRDLRPRARALRGAGWLLVGVAAVLLPAALRNLSAVGSFTPLPSSGGANLYAANGPDARRTVGFAVQALGGAPDLMEVQSKEMAEAAEGRDLGPYEVSSYWTARTLDERGSWGALVAHVGKKCALFWAAQEYGNNHWVGLERRFSTWLRVSPISAWWLLALGLGGWWLVRRRYPAADVAALTVALHWAALSLIYPVSRYRLPAVAIATVLAGAGVAEALSRRCSKRRLAAAAGLVLAATALAHLGYVVRPSATPVSSYVNLAGVLAKQGRTAEAREVFEEGLSRKPDDGLMHVYMARLLNEDGDFATALDHLRVADRAPDLRVEAAIVAMYSLARLGDGAQATATRDFLYDQGASNAEFLANAAVVDWLFGPTDRARPTLDRAARLDPDEPAVARARALLR